MDNQQRLQKADETMRSIFSTDSANTLTYILQELCISYISYKIFPKIK